MITMLCSLAMSHASSPMLILDINPGHFFFLTHPVDNAGPTLPRTCIHKPVLHNPADEDRTDVRQTDMCLPT